MDVLHFIEGRSLATLNIGQTVLILVSVLYLQITTEYIGRRMVPLDKNDIKKQNFRYYDPESEGNFHNFTNVVREDQRQNWKLSGTMLCLILARTKDFSK